MARTLLAHEVDCHPQVARSRYHLTSSVETIRLSLEPYAQWIEGMLGVPLAGALTLDADCHPADAVDEQLLQGLPVVAATKSRNNPFPVWEIDWQDCPVAFSFRGLRRNVISVQIPTLFPPRRNAHAFELFGAALVHLSPRGCSQSFAPNPKGRDETERYLETAYGKTRLQGKYDWDAVILDSNVRRLVRNDFELFFEREDWFRQHNLPN